MGNVRIGTVDIPERVERERYFGELDYLELSALFASPLRQIALQKWSEIAPPGAIGLVAPFVLTHRQTHAPKASKLWPHDATVGDFRASAHGTAALQNLREAAATVKAGCVVFRSPPLFAASAANRDTLKRFFGEIAVDFGDAQRVWIPDGLWQPRTAAAFATELGITVALDPLVSEPGLPPDLDLYEGLDGPSLYFRVSGLGRSSPLGAEALDELAALIESYEDADIVVAFDSPARWADAKNLTKLLSS